MFNEKRNAERENKRSKVAKTSKLVSLLGFFSLLMEASALIARGLFGLVLIAVRLLKETVQFKQSNMRIPKKL